VRFPAPTIRAGTGLVASRVQRIQAAKHGAKPPQAAASTHLVSGSELAGLNVAPPYSSSSCQGVAKGAGACCTCAHDDDEEQQRGAAREAGQGARSSAHHSEEHAHQHAAQLRGSCSSRGCGSACRPAIKTAPAPGSVRQASIQVRGWSLGGDWKAPVHIPRTRRCQPAS
jgi:hypothetical protein